MQLFGDCALLGPTMPEVDPADPLGAVPGGTAPVPAPTPTPGVPVPRLVLPGLVTPGLVAPGLAAPVPAPVLPAAPPLALPLVPPAAPPPAPPPPPAAKALGSARLVTARKAMTTRVFFMVFSTLDVMNNVATEPKSPRAGERIASPTPATLQHSRNESVSLTHDSIFSRVSIAECHDQTKDQHRAIRDNH